MKCKYEGTGVRAGRCVGTKEVDPCPGYDKCENYKPNYKTNADHIRAMSDEELAKDKAMHSSCPTCSIRGLCEKLVVRDCKTAWLIWLQQPCKEK